jgi:hypothetical protein
MGKCSVYNKRETSEAPKREAWEAQTKAKGRGPQKAEAKKEQA